MRFSTLPLREKTRETINEAEGSHETWGQAPDRDQQKRVDTLNKGGVGGGGGGGGVWGCGWGLVWLGWGVGVVWGGGGCGVGGGGGGGWCGCWWGGFIGGGGGLWFFCEVPHTGGLHGKEGKR